MEKTKMQPAVIVRGFVAGPSDVEEEKRAAIDTFGRWNGANSRIRRIIVEPVRMETHASPGYGDHPQNIINAQLLKDSDFLLAIFGTKLGTPTVNDLSGTLQEIREFAEQVANQQGCKERVLLCFRQANPGDRIDERLTAFHHEMQTKSLYHVFNGPKDLAEWLRHTLDLTINHLITDDAAKEILGNEALLTARQRLALDKDRALQQLEIDGLKAAHDDRVAFMKRMGETNPGIQW
jgi:hypothetical protein